MHRNSFANWAFGSQGRSGGYGRSRSPLRQDATGEDSEATTHRSGSEEDIRYQKELGMEEQDPAERLWGRVGADPVGQVVAVGPDVGEEPVPSQEPVLGGVGTDQGELGRSLLVQVLGS